MATLLDLQATEQHTLLSEYLIGRGSTCQLRLTSPLVSTTHAQIRWTGTRWEIHDLDSRNGTYVNKNRLDHGERMALLAGMSLGFGRCDELFTMIDDSPPVAHATSQHGKRREARNHMFVLPDAEYCTYTVFEEHGVWYVEDATTGEKQLARNGNVLSMGHDVWTLHLPAVIEPTWRRDAVVPCLRDMTLRFSVDRTGEHIGLTLLHPAGPIELAPRVHMEMLLRLAEARLDDQQRCDVGPAEAGWIAVSDLLTRLGERNDDAVSRNMLCQRIYQARRQLVDAGVEGAMDIVQRRDTFTGEGSRRTGQIRIGASRLEIPGD